MEKFDFGFLCGDFSGSSHTLVTSKLALQWLSCQAPGVKGLALELVYPVPIYCVTGPEGKVDLQLLSLCCSIMQLSEQIRP